MRCGVGCRRGWDPTLLWLWCRLVATALVRPLAWEPPYATGVALEKTKRQKKEIEALEAWPKRLKSHRGKKPGSQRGHFSEATCHPGVPASAVV